MIRLDEGMSRRSLRGDTVPEVLERPEGAPGDAVAAWGVEVAGAEILVRRLPRQGVVREGDEPVCEGHDGFLVAAAPEQPPLDRPDHDGGPTRGQVSFDERYPHPAVPGLRPPRSPLPALWLFPGQRPAQLAQCRALGKTAMSGPSSATRTFAVRRSTPR